MLRIIILIIAMAMSGFILFGNISLTLVNPGFENGLTGWDASKDNSMSTAAAEAAQTGKLGLRVTDSSETAGSDLAGQRFACQPGKEYRVSCKSRIVSGKGIGIYIKFADASGKGIDESKYMREVPASAEWQTFSYTATAPAGTATACIYIHSYMKAVVTADFDEFIFEEIGGDGARASLDTPAPAPAAQTVKAKTLDLPNAGFESASEGWSNDGDNGMSSIIPAAARTGKLGLRITDESKTAGSSLYSQRIPVTAGKEYKVSFFTRMIYGGGCGLYIQFFDADGTQIKVDPQDMIGLASSPQWKKCEGVVSVPSNAKTMGLWFHSYGHAIITQDVDDITIEEYIQKTTRPWEPLYKVKPSEKSRLTAADIIGPDGIVYPDFRWAGVPGGIPAVPVIVDLTGKVSPETDISETLEREATALGKRGGGALLIPEGTFYLDNIVIITANNVVIRGAGQDKTRLIFRYALPYGSVIFSRVKAGEPFGVVDIHAQPKDLKALVIECEGKVIRRAAYHAHWGNTFSTRAGRSEFLSKVGAGLHKVIGRAEYANGEKFENSIELMVSADPVEQVLPSQSGAIAFAGKRIETRYKLVKDGKRGDTNLTLEDASAFKPGDRLYLNAPTSPRWNEILHNANTWFGSRMNQYEITAVTGNIVHFRQALRIEFPIIDGAYVQKIEPIISCGIEDFYLEQKENIWINGVTFSGSWGCWAKGVTMRMAGKHPIYFDSSKFGELRDCVFDDAWFKGGGGTAYGGVEFSFDCLIENLSTTNLRHAPDFNWACSGNVVRNSTFINSDGQWHSGWCNENLLENLVIKSAIGNGGYGFGLFSTAPEDDAHGPIGPRNVIYNCDVASPKDGLILNGMNENWLVLHNRFVVEKGRGILARMASFDHIIRGNIFCLKNAQNPAIFLKDADCIGVEVIDNTCYGGEGPIVGGKAKPERDEGNSVLPFEDAPRPKPAVPSIYEWQIKNYPLK
ncbi:MAG: carbohydrate binding domain-containing protein [Spirochaetes bacterium]|nr:carbohydrate binding domain-containing protein [Spirochaetota bacterium]